MDPITLAAAWGLPVLGGVVWAVRQEGRINAHTQLFDQNKTLLDERHAEVLRRFDRLERKLDGEHEPSRKPPTR